MVVLFKIPVSQTYNFHLIDICYVLTKIEYQMKGLNLNLGLKRLWIILAICWGGFYLFVLSAKLYEVAQFEDFWVVRKLHAPIPIRMTDPVDPNFEFAYYVNGKKHIALEIPSSNFVGTKFEKALPTLKSGESFKNFPQETIFDITESLTEKRVSEEVFKLFNKVQPFLASPSVSESIDYILFGALPPIILYGLFYILNWLLLGFKSTTN